MDLRVDQGEKRAHLSLRILGLDPGSHITGVGIVESSGSKLTHVHHQLIKAPKGLPLPARLQFIFKDLALIAQKYRPQVVVVEQVFLGKNVDSAFKLGHARGVCMLALHEVGAETFELSAKEVKKILTGHGGASKEQVRQMVCQWLRVELVEKEMDISDALSLAISGSFEYEKRLRMKQFEGGI
jgi:crossover junction endodeoxyribonuclease RuvC